MGNVRCRDVRMLWGTPLRCHGACTGRSSFSTVSVTWMNHQVRAYRFVIAGLCLVLQFSIGLSFFAVAPVLPLIRDDYDINRGTASLLIAVVIMLQAVLSIPGGVLVGRIGVRRVFIGGWLLASAPVLSVLAGSFAALLVLRISYAIGVALLIPASGSLLMQWFRPRELPLINSVNLVAASVGIAASTLSAALLADVLGWRGVLSLYGSLTLAGALAWMVLGRTPGELQDTVQSLSLREVWSVIRSRTTLLLALADLGPYAQYVAMATWLPTFYHEELGMSLSKAGFVVGLLPLTGVFTLVVVGLLALRVERRKPFLIVPGVLVGFAGFGSFLGGNTPVLYLAVILLGFCSWLYLPILFTIPMDLPNMSPQRVALVWATILTIGSTASFISPVVVGSMTDLLGTYLPSFSLWAVLSWSLLLGGILLPETGRGRRAHRPPIQ